MEGKAQRDTPKSSRTQPSRQVKTEKDYKALSRASSSMKPGGDSSTDIGTTTSATPPSTSTQAPGPELQQLMAFMSAQAQAMKEMQEAMKEMRLAIAAPRQPAVTERPVNVPPVTDNTTSMVEAATSATAINSGTSNSIRAPATQKEQLDNPPSIPVKQEDTPTQKVIIIQELSKDCLKQVDVNKLEDTAMFDLWAVTFKQAMKTARLWGYFDGTYIWGSTAEAQDIYRGNDAVPFNYLMQKLPILVGSRLQEFSDAINSSRQAWHFLKTAYSRLKDEDSISIERQLFEIELKKGETVEDYLNRGAYLRTLLALAGTKISDRKWISMMDTGLKGRFESLSHTVSHDKKLTEEEYKTLLKQAAERAALRQTSKTHLLLNNVTIETTADVAAVRVKKNWSERQCYCCKEYGHSWRTCPNRHRFPTWKEPSPRPQSQPQQSSSHYHPVSTAHTGAVTVHDTQTMTQTNRTYYDSTRPSQSTAPAHFQISASPILSSPPVAHVNAITVPDCQTVFG